MTKRLIGTTVTQGWCYARAFFFKTNNLNYPTRTIDKTQVSEEFKRFINTIEKVKNEFEELKNHFNPELKVHRDLVNTYILLVSDIELHSYISTQLPLQLENIEQLMITYFDNIMVKLSHANNPVLRERYADFKDIKEHLLLTLNPSYGDNNNLAYCNYPTILVGKELPPLSALHLRNNVKAVVLEGGNVASHSLAILKEKGIPTLIQVKNLTSLVEKNCDIEIVGENSQVIIHLQSEEEDKS